MRVLRTRAFRSLPAERPNIRIGRTIGRTVIAVVLIGGTIGLVEPRFVTISAHQDPTISAVRFLRSVHATDLTDHHHGAGVHPVDPSQLAPGTARTLAKELTETQATALRWPTAGDALADGWTLAAPYEAHLGAHYMRFSDIDGVFDVRHPEMLLYGGDAATSPIVGVAYYVKYEVPVGFIGPYDRWHQHVDVCIGPSGPLVGADAVGVCATSATRPVGQFAWMLHAWVVPGRASPQGVFSRDNLGLP